MKTFNIIGNRKYWYSFSAIVIGACVAAMAIFGFNLGIDFTEGALVELNFGDNRPSIEELHSVLSSQGLEDGTVVYLGDESTLMRTKPLSAPEHNALLDSLTEAFGEESYVEARFETIGPTISEELRRKSLNMAVGVIFAIILYLTWVFRSVSKPVSSWKYGVIAVLALIHDVIVPAGAFAYLGQFMGVQIDTLFVTAMLTVMGFSVHDTIVVFDMVRETIADGATSFETAVNDSVNKTLSRSINTSLTTLVVLASIYFLGGESVRFFSLAMMIGIITGTYSSIFFASPLLVSWYNRQYKRS